jgi:flagellar hook-associated protein 1 FlgK
VGTLISSLNIALQSMQAEQEALATTTNNIANANTPGYTRETVSFEETPPVQYGGLLLGDGVTIGQITSQRDSLLQAGLEQQTQQQAKYNSYLGTMQQVQSLFNESSGNGVQGSVTAFFNSLQQLSTSPSDSNLRQAVLTAAQNMAQTFNTTAGNLSQMQQSANVTVTQTVNQINSLTSQIASVNAQVTAATASGQNAGTFIDQRDQLIQQLSGLVDVSTIDTGNGGVTLTTSNGTALVAGNQSFQLTTQTSAVSGFQDVYSQGSDITSSLAGGSLAGAIQARDVTIPSILSSLDALAYGIGSSVNSVNEAGTDLNGNAGGALFLVPASGAAGAASTIAAAITDPSKIAGSLNGTAGDNSNINAMLALQNQSIVNGQTPLNAYSNLVFQVGNDVSTAQANSTASSAMVQQLQNQISSVSGVDVNQESVNLVQYERAYQAAAQVSGIIDTLTATAINLGQSVTAA